MKCRIAINCDNMQIITINEHRLLSQMCEKNKVNLYTYLDVNLFAHDYDISNDFHYPFICLYVNLYVENHFHL